MFFLIIAICLQLCQNCISEQPYDIHGISDSRTVEQRLDAIRRSQPKNDHDKVSAETLKTMFNQVLDNYDRKFRPNYGGKAIKIQLELHVLSFSAFDEGAMEFGMDFYFAQIWKDERFKIDKVHQNALLNLVGNDVDKVWLPDTVFVNSKSSKFHDVTVNNRFLMVNFSSGGINYHSRITTRASCRMDLRDYPFDQQTCFLAIESYGHDREDILYEWYNHEQANCTDPKCVKIFIYDREMSNFDVVEAVKSKNKTIYHADSFSSATAQFTFQRRTQYFILQVYLPCSLIVMVTWTSFWITPTAVPARASICVTTILTLITMLGIVNANMPKVSYIKALDLYLFVSFIFVFLSLLEYIVVLNIASRWDMKKLKKKNIDISTTDKYNNKLKTILEEKFKNGSIRKHYHRANHSDQDVYFSNTRFRRNFNEKRNKCHEDTVIDIEARDNCTNYHHSKTEARSNNEQQSKDVHFHSSMTDMAARFLFPIAYACFNVGYWTSYLTQTAEFQKSS